MDWKHHTTLGELPRRSPLRVKIFGRWEATTPYELLEHYRLPRFLTVSQVEYAMEIEITTGGVPEERAACLPGALSMETNA